MEKKRTDHFQYIISFIIALLVIGTVWYQGSALKETLVNACPEWTIAGLLCYMVNYMLRAARFRSISENNIPLWPEAVHCASLHGLATYMFPFRTGELTLPVILKSISGIPVIEGSRILFKARVLDILTLGGWMICAALLTRISMDISLRIAWGMSGVFMCLLPQILKWLWKLGWLTSPMFLERIKFFITVTLRQKELILSAGIWLATALCIYSAARAVGLSLAVNDVWFLIAFQLPLQLLPVQGIANAGNHEGGWVAALAVIGIPASQGLTFALASHALILFYVLALGPVALLTRRLIKNNNELCTK